MKVIYENKEERYHTWTFRDMDFPLHLHADLEILWLWKGELDVTAGQYHRRLCPGEIAVIFPHQTHSYHAAAGVSNEGILAIFPPASFGEFQTSLTQYHPVDPFLKEAFLHQDILHSLQLLSQITDVQRKLPLFRAYIHLILAHLLPGLTLQQNKDGQPLNQTTRLIQYLSEHFTESVSLQTLAEELHISRYQVSRIFSGKLNTSFSSYINTLRIDHGKKLLRTTNLDILSISEQCGYETLRTFNREFRSHCGCSPREYRRNLYGRNP